MEINKINYQALGIIIIRYAAALTMIIHGITRIVIDGVFPFGEFLTFNNLPFGTLIAWLITIFEITAGSALLLGYFILPVSIIFIIEHLSGIILVHLPEGWFVVGAGRNGMEYSVILIILFISTILFNLKKTE